MKSVECQTCVTFFVHELRIIIDCSKLLKLIVFLLNANIVNLLRQHYRSQNNHTFSLAKNIWNVGNAMSGDAPVVPLYL